MAFLVGVQMYTVRKESKENFYGTLKKIKAMGYDGVEFAGLHGHTAEEVKENTVTEDAPIAEVEAEENK